MHDPATHFYIRTTVALLIAVGVLIPCGWLAVGGRAPKPVPTENYIAFNMTVFIVLGFALAISAADRWPAACLWAGAAMLAGGVVGVLFGVPTAADAANNAATTAAVKTALADPANTPAVIQPAGNTTLLSTTASWMSKFLAGAGFAQANTLLKYFIQLAHTIGSYIVFPENMANADALAGGILLYFIILGFFCGLIVPYYYVTKLP